jgi:simple sugar transport system permease protein
VKAVPLTLCGLGVAIGFHTGFTNIGAEGQFYIGAVVTTALGTFCSDLPGLVLLPLCFFAGFIASGIWAAIPGFLRARYGVSEVINTIMFNYIAICIVGILLQTSLKDPNNFFPQSAYMPESMSLPVLIRGTRLHAGLIVALICAALVYLLVWRTKAGFDMRAVGLNARACKCSGIGVAKSILLSSMLSGGLAGLAGVCEITGLQHRLMSGISPGYGYLAIITALLGRNHPVGIILASIGIAALQVGAQGMQRSAGVPNSIADIIMAVIVLLILARHTLEKVLKKKGGKV